MARTLVQIKKQIAKLQKEADQVRAKEVAGVVARIKVAIDFYGLKATDLFGSGPGMVRKGKKVGNRPKKTKTPAVAKYKDKETGKTWTGHGKRPGWFLKAIEGGVKPEDMAI